MTTRKRYVAFLDILGFKSILKNVGSADSLGVQMSELLQASILSALTGKTANVDINQNLDVRTDIRVYQFSDAIILYTEEDKDESLYKVIVVLNLLFAQSILRGLPLRGALTFGDLYVNGSIIVGEPMVKASELEGRQEWSGLIVDCKINSSLLSKLKDERLVTNWDVALKKLDDKQKIELERRLVLNWPQYCGIRVSSLEEFEESMARFSGKSNKEEHLDKRNRTIDFFKKNLGTKPLPGFQFDAGKLVLSATGTLTIKND